MKRHPFAIRHDFDLEHVLEEEELPRLPLEPGASRAQVLAVPDAPEPVEVRRRLPPTWILVSVGLHVAILGLLVLVAQLAPPMRLPETNPVEILPIDLNSFAMPGEPAMSEQDPTRPTLPRPETFDDPQAQRPRGQFVSLAPPPQPVLPPQDARYMAADDHRTERETRANKVQVNPDVLADKFSKTAQESGNEGDSDTQADNKATGGAPSAEQDPPQSVAKRLDSSGEEATLAEAERVESRSKRTFSQEPPRLNIFPSPQQLASALGSSGGASSMRRGALGPRSGAPDNNVLDVAEGDSTELNARRTEYAKFFAALRRQFNYYYTQASDNLGRNDIRERVFEKTYITRFEVTLGPDGRVAHVSILSSAGVSAFDSLVLEALRNASPFPSPPKSLLDERGLLVLGGECRLGVGLGVPTFAR